MFVMSNSLKGPHRKQFDQIKKKQLFLAVTPLTIFNIQDWLHCGCCIDGLYRILETS